MEKITMSKLDEIMLEYNSRFPENADTAKIFGVIVFKQSNFTQEYSELSRSYRVSNANRRYQHGKISNSLRGECLDGTESGVRLDWYNWEVEYCYML